MRSVVRDHHERWDGSGYPRGLSATGSASSPRVAAIADVFDAMTSQRPYAPAEPPDVGVRIISDGAGTAFDPAVVAVFRKVVMPYPVGTELRCPTGASASSPPPTRRGPRSPSCGSTAPSCASTCAPRRPEQRPDGQFRVCVNYHVESGIEPTRRSIPLPYPAAVDVRLAGGRSSHSRSFA